MLNLNDLKPNNITELKAGDWLELSGTLIVMRDAAHKRLFFSPKIDEALEKLLKDKVIFYAGPTPFLVNGSGVIGPTTSARMDRFVEPMLNLGVKGFLGKGGRGKSIDALMRKYKAVYFATAGGAAALLSKFVKQAKIIAYQDLGPEAIYRIEVDKLPVIVATDTHGNNIFER